MIAVRLSQALRSNAYASSRKTPLAAQAAMPITTVCLGPTVSAMRPAWDRLSKVATYCTLIARPARTEP
ncbi:hypothetical protein D3C72_1889230 [compost metagenome]